MDDFRYELDADGIRAIVVVYANTEAEGLRELRHYAWVYAQDGGPVKAFRRIGDKRIPVDFNKYLKLVVNRKEEPVTQREYDRAVERLMWFCGGFLVALLGIALGVAG